jgi:hypothetical protein
MSKTMGLCGTFNNNQQNDFLTMEGDIEINALDFANKWKVDRSCPDLTGEDKDPCATYPQKQEEAKEKCGILNGPLFKGGYMLNNYRVSREELYNHIIHFANEIPRTFDA